MPTYKPLAEILRPSSLAEFVGQRHLLDADKPIGKTLADGKLHSMILAHPTKSRIRTIQAIGRLLRKHETKDKAIVYDLADDLSWKKHKNYGLNHYQLRVKYYNQEKLDYTVKRIKI